MYLKLLTIRCNLYNNNEPITVAEQYTKFLTQVLFICDFIKFQGYKTAQAYLNILRQCIIDISARITSEQHHTVRKDT